MRILICSPEHNRATGNWVTAQRYADNLRRHNHQVDLCHLPPQSAALATALESYRPELLLLLHAYRTGKAWLELAPPNLPTVVLLSGTDVNEGLQRPDQAAVIEQVMSRCQALLAHNPQVVAWLGQRYPHLQGHLHHLPPGIVLGQRSWSLRQPCGIPDDAVLFLCPASIRPVKGVVALIELFDHVAAEPSRWQVAFCGPSLDDSYSRRFFAAVKQRSWAHYLGVIPPEAMPSAMRQADVILNNSTSEGLPNALIEAASLGRPILAHDIAGNRPIVESGVNGLLYHDSASFTAAVESLIARPQLRRQLCQPQPERYHPELEARVLHHVCQQAREQWSATSA